MFQGLRDTSRLECSGLGQLRAGRIAFAHRTDFQIFIKHGDQWSGLHLGPRFECLIAG